MRWPKKHVIWPKYFRLINSAFPTIDLFEDIAGPADWLLLGSAESKTNPRVADTIGNLDLIPPTRRVRGDGATYVMTPFTHISPDWAGRFHDGTFGAFYGADSFETALAETMYHTAKFCAATEEKPGWIADKRELIGRIDAELIDICDGYNVLLDEADYAASQAFARKVRDDGEEGILYPSVRNAGGLCFAAFFPDVMRPPIQARHISYHWDGSRIDMIKDYTNDKVYALDE